MSLRPYIWRIKLELGCGTGLVVGRMTNVLLVVRVCVDTRRVPWVECERCSGSVNHFKRWTCKSQLQDDAQLLNRPAASVWRLHFESTIRHGQGHGRHFKFIGMAPMIFLANSNRSQTMQRHSHKGKFQNCILVGLRPYHAFTKRHPWVW